jgi:two-component system phosphate regulon sensor histidine kinase PhoR
MPRRLISRDSFVRRLLAPPVLVGLGVVAVVVLVAMASAAMSGYDGGIVLVATTIGGVCAITALVAIAVADIGLIRTAGLEGARAHAMMTAMKDGVCCIDETGRVTYMNPAAERMLGRRFEDHVAGALAAVFPSQHRDDVPGDQASPLLASALAGVSYAGRDSVICANGQVLSVDIRMEPIVLNGMRAGTVLVFADDTDRRREEQAKDDFVGFASHELRSPLTALHGFSSWLARKLEREPSRFDADTAEAISALVSETGRMESIIELFLDLTQIRMDRLSLEPDLVDLTKVLREEGAAVRSRYAGAHVQEALPETRILAILDEQRLRQIVLNLLDNAAKYGGVDPEIVISLTVSDGIAELRVKDSGSGIPREDQRHIFERFFRSTAPATGQKKGLGIGLYVTKQIVDRMDGELSFTSEEGRGTEFTLRLPLAREGELDEEGAREAEPAMARR